MKRALSIHIIIFAFVLLNAALPLAAQPTVFATNPTVEKSIPQPPGIRPWCGTYFHWNDFKYVRPIIVICPNLMVI